MLLYNTMKETIEKWNGKILKIQAPIQNLFLELIHKLFLCQIAINVYKDSWFLYLGGHEPLLAAI